MIQARALSRQIKGISFAEILGILGLLLFTLFFSTFAITESPSVWYDEGYYLQLAQQYAEHGTFRLQIAPDEFVSAGYVTVGFPLTLPVAEAFKLFGVGVLQARAVMVVFILAFVAAGYFLVRALVGYRLALLGMAFLATFPLLYGNGKSVLGEVPGLFFLTVFLYAVHRLERDRFLGFRWYALAGLCAGLAIATKPIFVLLVPAVLVVVVLKRKEIIFRWGAIAGGCAVALVPIAVWLMTQFSGDSPAQILSYYANPYAVHDVWRMMFDNALRFFTEATPLHFGLFSGVWLCAIAMRLYSREKIPLAEALAFSFTLIIAVAYLRTAGWYRYFFPAHVFTLLFAPASLAMLLGALQRRFPRFVFSRITAFAGTTIAVVLICLFQTYQLGFNSWVAGYYHSTRTEALTAYFSTLDPALSVFVYEVPEVVVFLQTDTYYQYLHPQPNLEIGREQLAVIAEAVPDRIVLAKKSFTKDPELFDAYTEEAVVGGYLILKRR